jgi:hypothetical protein
VALALLLLVVAGDPQTRSAMLPAARGSRKELIFAVLIRRRSARQAVWLSLGSVAAVAGPGKLESLPSDVAVAAIGRRHCGFAFLSFAPLVSPHPRCCARSALASTRLRCFRKYKRILRYAIWRIGTIAGHRASFLAGIFCCSTPEYLCVSDGFACLICNLSSLRLAPSLSLLPHR